ncbi:hypothetical protein C5471_17795 [Photorhabdus tasmaniensis]|uniref:Uncharacterized protein n=1 Tax=Photorhabdus tasmaniensis TaxID=1004159 RepID=A0ABX0GKR7_9GAMM|nr:hypothetical protein [Photorhabdus tasmaniensis]
MTLTINKKLKINQRQKILSEKNIKEYLYTTKLFTSLFMKIKQRMITYKNCSEFPVKQLQSIK